MTKKVVIPLELKYDFTITAYASIVAAFLYAIREEYGAAAALKIYKMVTKMDDRIKNLINFFRTVFKIQGDDAETCAQCLDIWYELTGYEVIWLERSNTIFRNKVTKCPWKLKFKDLSDRCSIFNNLVIKTINPQATFERPKGMCAGDPYCEFAIEIEE